MLDENHWVVKVKAKGQYSSSWGIPTSEPQDVTCQYLPPDTSECIPPNPRLVVDLPSTYPRGMEG